MAAVDLGAESGRVVAVSFDGHRMRPDVVRRFTNGARRVDGILRWDTGTLWRHVSAGLSELAADSTVTSVGVDSWGVDYALLRVDGTLVDEPTCYRDPRQLRAMRRAVEDVGAEALYAATGTQVMQINTVFALMDDARTSARLAEADVLLMMPDLFHHLLSGSRATERTAASTTGAYDLAGETWATGLLEALGVPTGMLPTVMDAGTDLGPLSDGRGLDGRGLAGTRVIAPAAHDTASAVAATPFADPGGLFVSCGTWSLVGVERSAPLVNAATSAADLTNEGGVGGTTLLLRNVMGLWLLQECRRQWAREGHELDWSALAALAAAEPALRSVVNPNAPEFVSPDDMPAAIRGHCARHGEPVPDTVGAVARCVVDSLALSYRAVAVEIAAVTGVDPPSVSITGGGSQHELLAQATADATGRPVHCGPVEATALGNAGVQLISLGELGGVADLRRVVAASTGINTFQPTSSERWEGAAHRLRRLADADSGARRRAGARPGGGA